MNPDDMPPSGCIFNIQRYSVQDGPGIRTTVFLKGCPLRCEWCHNPESQSDQPVLMRDPGRCLRCGACEAACPEGLDGAAARQPSDCRVCGACAEACPTGALRLAGAEMSAPEVLREILKDRLFFEESGGGVTFSGGEPLRQSQFLLHLLRDCRKEGVHTAVDTCGDAPDEILREVAGWTDLFLYDLKLVDDAAHQRFTGVTNRRILENLEMLHRIHRHLWIRIPLVPGVNDHPGHLEKMARLIAALPGIRRVDLLPFHRHGEEKRHRLGRERERVETRAPSTDSLAEAEAIFLEHGVNIHFYN